MLSVGPKLFLVGVKVEDWNCSFGKFRLIDNSEILAAATEGISGRTDIFLLVIGRAIDCARVKGGNESAGIEKDIFDGI